MRALQSLPVCITAGSSLSHCCPCQRPLSLPEAAVVARPSLYCVSGSNQRPSLRSTFACLRRSVQKWRVWKQSQILGELIATEVRAHACVGFAMDEDKKLKEICVCKKKSKAKSGMHRKSKSRPQSLVIIITQSQNIENKTRRKALRFILVFCTTRVFLKGNVQSKPICIQKLIKPLRLLSRSLV